MAFDIKNFLEYDAPHNFDICLMNPPYDRNLHLDFLSSAINVADKVVSVQPIRWLEDPTAIHNKNSAYKKYENNISKHISDIEIITAENTKTLFNILSDNLGIYICDKTGGYDYEKLSQNSIMDKIINHIKVNKCNFEFNKKDGYRVRVPFISGGKAIGSGGRPPKITELPIKNIVFYDGKKDGRWWYEYYTKNQYSKTTEEITSSIKFNSEQEGYNFIDSCKTDFVRYVESKLITDVHIGDNKILWMGNSVNPRTNKKGYASDWTDSDFEIFFELSVDEIQKYKSFMKDYRTKMIDWYKSHNKKIPDNI